MLVNVFLILVCSHTASNVLATGKVFFYDWCMQVGAFLRLL